VSNIVLNVIKEPNLNTLFSLTLNKNAYQHHVTLKARRIRWEGHVPGMGERRGVYRVLAEKPVGKRPLGRPRHRWEDNIKMDLQEVGLVGWTGSSWLRIGTGGGH
jgi:hypothetical protein